MATLSEAIRQKYLATEDTQEECPPDTRGFVIFKPRTGLQHCVPNVLVISSSEIEAAGDTALLSKYLERVSELDISHNNLTNLNEIATVIGNAPNLKFINLGFNDLSAVSTSMPPSIQFPQLDSLNTLILVGTNAKWQSVWFILRHTKNVTELHLSVNKYGTVELPMYEDEVNSETIIEKGTEVFRELKMVMFDENPVTEWEDIAKLGIIFPNLCQLSLTGCPISVIPSEAASTLQNLRTLWMSNTLISKLEQLEKFKLFPSLTDLRISGIPLFQDFPEQTRRQHFIALLPNIEVLNRGRPITSDERESAERNFIRYYLDQPDPPPRFHDLKSKHDEVHQFVEVNFKPPTSVNLLIRYDLKEIARITVKLKITVTELKNILEPIIGVEASELELHYLDVGLNFGKQHMNFPNKQLYTYNMQDNDEIFVRKRRVRRT